MPNRAHLAWLIALFIVVLPAQALAAQRFAGPAGSGTTCSDVSPCAIAEAVNNAAEGDEVIVKPGSCGSSGTPLAAGLDNAFEISVHGEDGQARPQTFTSAATG